MVDDSKKDTIFARFFDKNIDCGTINAKQPSYRYKLLLTCIENKDSEH